MPGKIPSDLMLKDPVKLDRLRPSDGLGWIDPGDVVVDTDLILWIRLGCMVGFDNRLNKPMIGIERLDDVHGKYRINLSQFREAAGRFNRTGYPGSKYQGSGYTAAEEIVEKPVEWIDQRKRPER